MLKKDLFKDKDEGIKKVTSIIKSQVEIQGGTFNPEIPKEKFKKVWYRDTENHELHENTGLLIRVKENQEKSEYKVEFKVRNPIEIKQPLMIFHNPVKNPKI